VTNAVVLYAAFCIRALRIFASIQKFTKLCRRICESHCNRQRRSPNVHKSISLTLSEIAQNFGRFLPPPRQLIEVQSPKHLRPDFHACLAAHDAEWKKFGEVIRTDPKLLANYSKVDGQLFEFVLLKIVRDPVADGVCVNKPRSLSHVTI